MIEKCVILNQKPLLIAKAFDFYILILINIDFPGMLHVSV